jgi:hypothetical protein
MLKQVQHDSKSVINSHNTQKLCLVSNAVKNRERGFRYEHATNDEASSEDAKKDGRNAG